VPDYSPPIRGQAYRIFITLEDQANAGLDKANPTIAAGDFQRSLDGGAFANLTTLPSVTPAGSVSVQVDLSAAEMTADNVLVHASDAAGAEWFDRDIIIQPSTDVWDELIAGHLGAGSTGAALNAAGAAGDPWLTALPGAYLPGTAGDIIGNICTTMWSCTPRTLTGYPGLTAILTNLVCSVVCAQSRVEATYVPLFVEAGTTRTVTGSLYYPDMTPVDLTGATLKWATSTGLTKESPATIDILLPTTGGGYEFVLSAAETQALVPQGGTAVKIEHQLKVKLATGEIYAGFEGDIRVDDTLIDAW